MSAPVVSAREIVLANRLSRPTPMVFSRAERNKVWVQQYRAGLSTIEIAERWEFETGEKCYDELVRRTLEILGVPRRPPGTRTVGRRGMQARIAELERQVAQLMKTQGAP